MTPFRIRIPQLVNILEAGFLIVFWMWALTAALFLRNTVLPRLPLTITPEQLGLASDTVQFEATDGVRLEGWLLRAKPEKPWVILCHGLGTNRSDLLEIAARLYERGMNVFLFDFRGHGRSVGRLTSFGWREQQDLEGALAFLGRQPDIPPRPSGVYGISLGGSVALMVAARDERLGAVIADSPFLDLRTSLRRHLKLMFPWLPWIPFGWFCESAYRLCFGQWPAHVSPRAAIAQISPRPILLIQGGQDHRMPLEDTQQLLASAREPKALWVIPEAEHLGGYAVNPHVYVSRLVEFFEQSLK